MPQGEANADQKMNGSTAPLTKYYAAYYQSMIADWRERKGMGDFAFSTVQLPPSQPAVTPPEKGMDTGRAEIRLAEAETAPHSGGLTDISGVAVTLDCGGKSAWGWDHPPNKNEISRRLALQTVHAAYAVQGRIPGGKVCDSESPSCNDTSLWTGPVFESATANGKQITLSFQDFSADGLSLKDVKSTNPDGTTNNCTRCCVGMPPFEVSSRGADWTRIPLSEIKIDGSRIMLHSAISDVTRIRMNWADYIDCVLVNGDGLPASPFAVNVEPSTLSRYSGASSKHTSQSFKSDAPHPIPKSVLAPPMVSNLCYIFRSNILSLRLLH